MKYGDGELKNRLRRTNEDWNLIDKAAGEVAMAIADGQSDFSCRKIAKLVFGDKLFHFLQVELIQNNLKEIKRALLEKNIEVELVKEEYFEEDKNLDDPTWCASMLPLSTGGHWPAFGFTTEQRIKDAASLRQGKMGGAKVGKQMTKLMNGAASNEDLQRTADNLKEIRGTEKENLPRKIEFFEKVKALTDEKEKASIMDKLRESDPLSIEPPFHAASS